ALPLAVGTDRDRERTQNVRLAPALERAEERVVPTAREVFLAPVPRGRDGVELGDELAAVEQGELAVGEVLVETAPVEVPRHVVVHVLRERRARQRLEPDLAQV